jgi:hypothetical protein
VGRDLNEIKKITGRKKTGRSYAVIFELLFHGQRDFKFKNDWQTKTKQQT